MHVGTRLLELIRLRGARTVFVVGTGKNAGKTVVARAILGAAREASLQPGICSIGRDGESEDVIDGRAKPRYLLAPGTLAATARGALPRTPAVEILDRTAIGTSVGEIFICRSRGFAAFEIVGPPAASGVREVVQALRAQGAGLVIVDGAVDRVAAVAVEDGAIIIAVGVHGRESFDEVVLAGRALAAKLMLPVYDPRQPAVHVRGALLPEIALALAAEDPERQIVVEDPTRVAAGGRTFLGLLERARLRTARPLSVAALTVNAVGRERAYDPQEMLQCLAAATGLPAFDVFAAAAA